MPIFACREDQMGAWLKAIGRTDDGPIYWWFTGITHGLTPDDGLKPLFRHENFSFGPYSRESDTRHTSVMQDITYYRDLDTGELIREYENPYTGERLHIVEVVTNDIRNFYDVNGNSGFIADGQEMHQPFEISATAVKDDVWMTRTMDWSLPNPLDPVIHANAYTGPMIRMQMETTLHIRRTDLDDGSKGSVPATSGYEAITPWFPWLHMGGRDGCLVTRAVGAKLNSYAELPPEILALGEARFPGCFTETADPPRGKDPWTDYMDSLGGNND